MYVLTTRLFRKALQTHTHTCVSLCVVVCVSVYIDETAFPSLLYKLECGISQLLE